MNAVRRVVFRVDGSIEMGLGHLTRCMTLARALADEGASIFFVLRSHAAGLRRLIEGEGHSVLLLADPEGSPRVPAAEGTAHAHWLPTAWHEDAKQTLDAIDRIGAIDWIVVDHYALDARWERAVRMRAPRILAIDDLADRSHDCDVMLDQNLVPDMENRYRGLLPAACTVLLGPHYALLRPEFAEQRRLLAGRSGRFDRIFVCYGGSDPGNETAKALAAIMGLVGHAFSVDVVVGASNPHVDSVAALCEALPGAVLHRGANNIAELMARADLAIGAGGVMCWERCCLGLPTLAVEIAANQASALTALAAAGALLHLGPAASVTEAAIARELDSLRRNAERLRRMGEAAQALVDGGGAQRVVHSIFC